MSHGIGGRSGSIDRQALTSCEFMHPRISSIAGESLVHRSAGGPDIPHGQLKCSQRQPCVDRVGNGFRTLFLRHLNRIGGGLERLGHSQLQSHGLGQVCTNGPRATVTGNALLQGLFRGRCIIHHQQGKTLVAARTRRVRRNRDGLITVLNAFLQKSDISLADWCLTVT